MKTLQFKCTFLTDVVLNAKAVTEGPQSTIDFIPGNCFLGIVASQYEHYSNNGKSADLFHNGTVRYGDAHPAIFMNGEKIRSLRIPASFYYPKLKSPTEECYVHHAYHPEADHEGKNGKSQQLKQCRSGFFGFYDGLAIKISLPVSFSIKSAYDRTERRAKDEQMYGYQSLDKGSTFYFEVEIDNENFEDDIKKALVGKRRIGRSRSAQYGLVEISLERFYQATSSNTPMEIDGEEYALVYSDSRLVFMGEDGMPQMSISAKDLGLDGEIDWTKSQIRTFQYAPWNFKRQARDMDRFGVEKGSVFAVRLNTKGQGFPTHVGAFRNEGFGKVIVNPWFLASEPGSNGLTSIKIKEYDSKSSLFSPNARIIHSPLISFLNKKAAKARTDEFILEEVDNFIIKHSKLFKNQEFASQWGTIRSIAMRCKDSKELRTELFDKTITIYRNAPKDNPEKSKPTNTAYLYHGVAEKKWKERGRRDSFYEFFNRIIEYGDTHNEDIVVEAVIELASEMAKIISKNGKN